MDYDEYGTNGDFVVYDIDEDFEVYEYVIDWIHYAFVVQFFCIYFLLFSKRVPQQYEIVRETDIEIDYTAEANRNRTSKTEIKAK